MYLEMLPPLINVTSGARRAHLAYKNCPPAAQHKQAKRACCLILCFTDFQGFFVESTSSIVMDFMTDHGPV